MLLQNTQPQTGMHAGKQVARNTHTLQSRLIFTAVTPECFSPGVSGLYDIMLDNGSYCLSHI